MSLLFAAILVRDIKEGEMKLKWIVLLWVVLVVLLGVVVALLETPVFASSVYLPMIWTAVKESPIEGEVLFFDDFEECTGLQWPEWDWYFWYDPEWGIWSYCADGELHFDFDNGYGVGFWNDDLRQAGVASSPCRFEYDIRCTSGDIGEQSFYFGLGDNIYKHLCYNFMVFPQTQQWSFGETGIGDLSEVVRGSLLNWRRHEYNHICIDWQDNDISISLNGELVVHFYASIVSTGIDCQWNCAPLEIEHTEIRYDNIRLTRLQ